MDMKINRTKKDALEALWKKENGINIPSLVNGSKKLTEEESQRLRDYMANSATQWDQPHDYTAIQKKVETEGLSSKVNIQGVSSEFSVLKDANAGNLGAYIDALASRYVALFDQLERNYSGDELKAQKSELEQFLAKGRSDLADSYADRLKESLLLSDEDAQGIKDSINSIIDQRIEAFQAAQGKVNDALTGTKDEWLKNNSAYMAARLRESVGAVGNSASGGAFTLADLRSAGEVGGAWQKMYSSHGKLSKPCRAAMDMAMLDMKTDALLKSGILSSNMANALQSTAANRQNKLLGSAGGSENFQQTYNAIMNTYRKSGNAVAAIRDGAAMAERIESSSYAANPKGKSIGESIYWQEFFQEHTTGSASSPFGARTHKSEFQRYADSWLQFQETLKNAGTPDFSSAGTTLPNYNAPVYLDFRA